jgi:endonuclease/exonuclease/phosphatase family metal-dependent hydrolase
MLVMILGNVFTTVYDYIPVIGLAFRDKFWLIHLLVGAALFPPLLFSMEEEKSERKFSPSYVFLLIFIIFVSAGLVNNQVSPKPIEQMGEHHDLRILTYNIQQGYSEDGAKNFDGQLDLIKALDPDIIGLQESDTNRIAGGNVDIVRYFADQLDMYSYYGPSVVTGTFGIALISKYLIEDAKTYYMYSEGEQTAVIEAQISVSGETLNVYVTHLGNGGPIIQQEQVLEILEGKENIIAMGDFNFRPDSDQYDLTVDLLEDTFLISEEEMAIQGFDVSDRIDHVFVSPGILVEEAFYISGPQSDHPAMFVVIGW